MFPAAPLFMPHCGMDSAYTQIELNKQQGTTVNTPKKKEILLLTSSDTENVFIKLVLGASRFTFGTARTTEQGIAYARLVKPDLILVDAEFPPNGALDLAEQISVDPRTSDTPLVIIGRREVLQKLPEGSFARFSGVLIRPIPREELRRLVEELLGVVRGGNRAKHSSGARDRHTGAGQGVAHGTAGKSGVNR